MDKERLAEIKKYNMLRMSLVHSVADQHCLEILNEIERLQNKLNAASRHICRECMKVCAEHYNCETPCHNCQWRGLEE